MLNSADRGPPGPKMPSPDVSRQVKRHPVWVLGQAQSIGTRFYWQTLDFALDILMFLIRIHSTICMLFSVVGKEINLA